MRPPTATVDPAGPPRIPLTAIDEVVEALETPAEPWGVEAEIQVGGRLDPERLRSAMARAIAGHPMAGVGLAPGRLRDSRQYWQVGPAALAPSTLAVVDAGPPETLRAVREELHRRPVHLQDPPPFRSALVHGPGGDRVLLNVNHAAIDGPGALRLLAAIGRAYAGVDDPPPPVALDEARNLASLLRPRGLAERGRRLRLLGGKVGDVVRPPARLVPEKGSDGPGYGFEHVALPAATTERLRRSPHTVSVLLLAALHVAIEGWNRERGDTPHRISTLVAVNLRPEGWRNDVVTNLVLDARVVSSRSSRAGRSSLLGDIERQMVLIRHGGGAALAGPLQGWSRWPLWAKRMLSPTVRLVGRRLVDTAVVSNLGRVEAPPDFGPDGGATEGLWFSPPARLPCGLAVGAATVGGRLHLSIRYRHPLLGPDTAAAFTESFVAALGSVADA